MVLPHTSKSVPYDALKDFTPIAISTTNYLVVVGGTGSPFKSLPEMIAWAKANPGKLTVATNGEGGFPHLIFEHLRMMGNFSFNHIPYKGSAQIATDLIGGQVQAGVDGVTGLTPHIKSGRINLLAVTSKNRVAELPDVPTMIQSGYPNFDVTAWFGLFVPAGTPKPIIDKLYAAVKKSLETPEIKQRWKDLGGWAVGDTPANTKIFIAAEKKKWEQVAQQAKIEAE